jgi:hypothetical protein
MSTHAISLETNERSSRPGNTTRKQSAPGEIGHPGEIGRGSVLVKPGTALPNSLTTSLRRVGAWNMIGLDSFALARALTKEKWHFSFVVPVIKQVSRKGTREKALRVAVEKLVEEANSRHFNAVEVTSVATSQLLGMYRVRITGHARHISDSPFLDDRRGLQKEKTTSAFLTHSVLLEIANTPQRLRRLMKGAHERSRQWPGDRKEYAVEELSVEQRYLPREEGLDETLAATFPCSDPLSTIPDPRS